MYSSPFVQFDEFRNVYPNQQLADNSVNAHGGYCTHPQAHQTQPYLSPVDTSFSYAPIEDNSWNLGGSSLYWTSNQISDPYFLTAQGAVYTSYPMQMLQQENFQPEDPSQASPPVPQQSLSFCEHGYPVVSPLEEQPFVTTRKCKKRKNKGQKIEDPNSVRRRPSQLDVNTVNFVVSNTSLLPQTPAPTTQYPLVTTLQRSVSEHHYPPAAAHPISTYGVRNSDHSKDGKHTPRAPVIKPPGQLNQASPSKFQTREWRPTPKRSSSNLQMATVSPSSSQTQFSTVPVESLITSRPVSSIHMSAKASSIQEVPSHQIKTDPGRTVQVEALPKTAAPVETTGVISRGKTIHGTPGLIEVPAGLKADVFGVTKFEPAFAAVLETKQPPIKSESDKVKLADERYLNKSANRKIKRQVDRVNLLQNQTTPVTPGVVTAKLTTSTSSPPILPVLIKATQEASTKPDDMDAIDTPVEINMAADVPDTVELENIKPDSHPLETTWTLYHMNGATRRKGADWNAGIQTIGVYDTVESFFFGYNSTPKASETAKNQDYMFFRGGKGEEKSTSIIQAAWEDVKNSNGGMWRFSIPMNARGATKPPSETVDFFWKEILMALIGEQFGNDNNFVNGCYFCNRGDEYRLQVWMACNDAAPVTAVGVRLAEVLQLNDNIYFDYCSHEEINRKGNRYAKALHDHQEICGLLSFKRKFTVP